MFRVVQINHWHDFGGTNQSRTDFVKRSLQGRTQKLIERGAKMTFCKSYGTAAFKTYFFWRSIFSGLYRGQVTDIMKEKDI